MFTDSAFLLLFCEILTIRGSELAMEGTEAATAAVSLFIAPSSEHAQILRGGACEPSNKHC